MDQTYSDRPILPDPSTAPALFEGVLTRRVFACCIDVFIIGSLVLVFSFIG